MNRWIDDRKVHFTVTSVNIDSPSAHFYFESEKHHHNSLWMRSLVWQCSGLVSGFPLLESDNNYCRLRKNLLQTTRIIAVIDHPIATSFDDMPLPAAQCQDIPLKLLLVLALCWHRQPIIQPTNNGGSFAPTVFICCQHHRLFAHPRKCRVQV